jgi:hypothetical protein
MTAGTSLGSNATVPLTFLNANCYYNGSNWIYKTSNFANNYIMDATEGKHKWFNAPSGTAGNAITLTQAMTLDASGNLLVGTTSGAYNGKIVSVAPSSVAALVLDAASGTNTGINFYNAGTIKWTTQVITTGEYRWYDFTAGAERARIDSSGNLLVGTSSATANGGVVQVSNGITFPATQVACSDANTLDDYEEGVWDAAFGSGGGTITINTASNRCRYTKIGRLITVNGFLAVSSVSSPTGPWLITGLPFTIAAGTEGDAYSALSIFPGGLETTATGQIVGYGLASSTTLYLYRYELGALVNLAPSAKAGSEIAFTFTYSI